MSVPYQFSDHEKALGRNAGYTLHDYIYMHPTKKEIKRATQRTLMWTSAETGGTGVSLKGAGGGCASTRKLSAALNLMCLESAKR